MKYIAYVLIYLMGISSPVFAGNDFINQVNEREESHIFEHSSDILEGGLSKIETLITMIDNFKIIDRVAKGEVKHELLEQVLYKFNKTIKENGNTKEVFIELYEYLNSSLPESKLTSESRDILTVLEDSGDCNDLSPAFYALFKYYGFNTKVIIGNSIKKETEDSQLHAWLGVYFDDDMIELDPLWYGPYIELKRIKTHEQLYDIRNEYIKTWQK